MHRSGTHEADLTFLDLGLQQPPLPYQLSIRGEIRSPDSPFSVDAESRPTLGARD
jgi:hypothetical protein